MPRPYVTPYWLHRFSNDTACMEAGPTSRIDPPLRPLPVSCEQTRPSSKLSILLLLLAVILGAVFESSGPECIQTAFNSVSLDHVSALAALFAALVAAVVLHEAGHLVAAMLMDFEILAVSLGPARISRVHGKWQVQFSGKLFTGSVSAVARSTQCWRRRMLIVVSGGPAATFVTGAIASVLLAYHFGGDWSKTFLGALVQLNVLLFALGFIPNGRAAKVRNDATLFSIFWSGAPEAGEILLYHRVARLELAGTRPRDYPEALIREMAAMQGRPDSMLAYAQLIALWALDRGHAPTAQAWDNRALELSRTCDKHAQQAALAGSACLDVLSRNDLAAAKRKFAEVQFELLSPAWFLHRAQAASSLVSGNVADTLSFICQANYAFPKRLPYFDFERTLLTSLHRKALALEPAGLPDQYFHRAA